MPRSIVSVDINEIPPLGAKSRNAHPRDAASGMTLPPVPPPCASERGGEAGRARDRVSARHLRSRRDLATMTAAGRERAPLSPPRR